MLLRRLIGAQFLLLPSLARAATAEPIGSGQALQVMSGLAIVLVLIALATWAARRVQSWRPHGHGHIRVIEGLAVGSREKLLLVEIDQQRVLIGMCPGRMQALANFPVAPDSASFTAALASTESLSKAEQCS
jgi:flagellar protein FliO/FliZ